MENVRVVYNDEMTVKTAAYVVEVCEDGTRYYTIVMNPKMSIERLKQSYEHELKHIKANDLESRLSADCIEHISRE